MSLIQTENERLNKTVKEKDFEVEESRKLMEETLSASEKEQQKLGSEISKLKIQNEKLYTEVCSFYFRSGANVTVAHFSSLGSYTTSLASECSGATKGR